MIKLTRIRTHPPIHENFFGAKRVAANLKLLKQKRDGELDKKGEKKWNSAFWKESKEQLLVESNKKCAYCETPTRVVAYGDVEHFRPKSVYWWLAYSYENYLPSCGACNQEYKKDFFQLEDKKNKLAEVNLTATMTDTDLELLAATLTVDPVDDAQGKKLADFTKETAKEKALLVNPYFDDPAKYFAYQPILETKEVFIVPTAKKYEKAVKACEKLFGLNRKELLDFRFQWYSLYATIRFTAEDKRIPAAVREMNEDKLKELRADDSPYAGMIRYFDTKSIEDLPWKYKI